MVDSSVSDSVRLVIDGIQRRGGAVAVAGDVVAVVVSLLDKAVAEDGFVC